MTEQFTALLEETKLVATLTEAIGVPGPVGPQGPQGVQGPQGMQGVQGEIGPQGIQGVQGPQGPQGIQGVPGEEGPPAPSSSVFYYRADTSSTGISDPGSGMLRWNNANQLAATELIFDVLTQDGFNVLILFKTMSVSSRFVIQDKDLAQKFQVFDMTGPVIEYVDYFGVPVAFVSAGPAGGQFSQNNVVAVLVESTGVTGPMGPQGPQGQQGIPGPEGPVGPIGASGSPGPQGAQGVQGVEGPQGPQGTPGQIGPTAIIQDKGTPLTQRSALNFVGAGVVATDDMLNNRTVVTIAGGGGGAAQTPWTQNIDGAGWSLSNIGSLTVNGVGSIRDNFLLNMDPAGKYIRNGPVAAFVCDAAGNGGLGRVYVIWGQTGTGGTALTQWHSTPISFTSAEMQLGAAEIPKTVIASPMMEVNGNLTIPGYPNAITAPHIQSTALFALNGVWTPSGWRYPNAGPTGLWGFNDQNVWFAISPVGAVGEVNVSSFKFVQHFTPDKTMFNTNPVEFNSAITVNADATLNNKLFMTGTSPNGHITHQDVVGQFRFAWALTGASGATLGLYRYGNEATPIAVGTPVFSISRSNGGVTFGQDAVFLASGKIVFANAIATKIQWASGVANYTGSETGCIYQQLTAGSVHRWYCGVADGGATDKMELSATVLTANVNIVNPTMVTAADDAAAATASVPVNGLYCDSSGVVRKRRT